MATKQCADCGKVKLPREFNVRTCRGNVYLMSICKACEKIRQQGYYRLRKLMNDLTGRS